MSYQVLARKWRPQTLDDVLGLAPSHSRNLRSIVDRVRPSIETLLAGRAERDTETLVREVNYVGLGAEIYGMVTDRFAKRHTGSVFSGQNTVGVTIDQLLSKERAQ